MKDESKSKQVLCQELASLRRRIEELERSESEWRKEKAGQKKSEVRATAEDVASGRPAEEAVRESEKKYRDLYDFLPIPVYEMDFEANITSANRAIYETFGGTEEDLKKGFNAWRLLTPESIEKSRKNIQKLLKGEQLGGTEYTFKRLDGSTFPAIVVSSIIYRDGTPAGLRGAIVDITERRKAEEALIQSEEKFRKAFFTSPDSVNINRLEDGMYISINPGFTRITGYTEEDIIGKTSAECNIWENIEDRQRLVAGLRKGGEVVSLEVVFRTKGGEIRYGLMSASIVDLDGVPHILSITRDITGRRRAEEALKKSETQYRLLADNVNDVIFILDMDLNYTYVSPSVKILRGYEPAEVLKQRSVDTLTPSSWALALRTLSEVMELEKSGRRDIPIFRMLPLEMLRKDGTTVWTEVKFSLIRDDSGRSVAILGVTRDITERMRAEERLQRTLKSLRNAVGATIQVMVSAVEIRDPYTAGHQLRSADLARAIATEMGLSRERIDGIRMAGSIHDIGKLSVPAEILSKPSKLTDTEFSLIKEHSQRGYEMLKDVESPWPLAQIVYQHHERMDGSGYPRNLKGEEILMEARILAVSDVVESMASHRPYRPALGIEAALEEIETNKGILYDNAVAAACLKIFREKGYQLPWDAGADPFRRPVFER